MHNYIIKQIGNVIFKWLNIGKSLLIIEIVQILRDGSKLFLHEDLRYEKSGYIN